VIHLRDERPEEEQREGGDEGEAHGGKWGAEG
jgi:hypothetical protein